MTAHSDNYKIVETGPGSVDQEEIYCIKDEKSEGFKAKRAWLCSVANEDLCLKIAFDSQDRQQGFIEYMPSEKAWRPIRAKDYLFIQCIAVFSKSARNQGLGKLLIQTVESDAIKQKKAGVCVICSDGSWMANKSLFVKNGFELITSRSRFDLLAKSFKKNTAPPDFIDWEQTLRTYKGWNLVYADQCPWHHKSVEAILEAAFKHGIDIRVQKLNSPDEAQNGPSGYGTFGLIRDGEMLADHYISKTRFENILKKLNL